MRPASILRATGLCALAAVVFACGGGSSSNDESSATAGAREPPDEEIAALGSDWYVALDGNDANDGRSEKQPFLSLQRGLDAAQPGDVVRLAPGRYEQDANTVRDGTEDRRITVAGSPDAMLVGGGKPHVFDVKHSFITLSGFTIDGHFKDEDAPGAYRDKLIYVQGSRPYDGVHNIRIERMTLRNAGGECIRLRYFAQDNEIAYNKIGPCGVDDFRFGGGGKNGEAIYIGTSSEQWADGKNPTPGPDLSANNWVHDNQIDTRGNECVEVKEGAHKNVIEFNTCTGQLDDNSAGFGARGDANVFRNNVTAGNKGAGFRLGGHKLCVDAAGAVVFDFDDDDAPARCSAPNRAVQYGIDNEVHANVIRDNARGGVLIQVAPQGRLCGNTMSGNARGDAAGNFAKGHDPARPCP